MQLIYEGKVDIEVANKKVTHKNKGTKHLFRLFSTLIAGQISQQASYPTYVMLFNSTSKRLIENPHVALQTQLLNKFLPVIKNTIEIDNTYGAMFEQTISPEDKLNVSAILSNGFSLGLIAGNQEEILAAVDIDTYQYEYLSSGSSLIVKWTMSLHNLEEISDNE